MKHRLCGLDELEPGQARRFDVDGRAVAVVRLGDDVYALGDTCSHANVSLSEGEVDASEKTVECWRHGSQFSLETGEPLSLPATRPVPVYEVVVDGTDVVLVLDDAATGGAGGSGSGAGPAALGGSADNERGARL